MASIIIHHRFENSHVTGKEANVSKPRQNHTEKTSEKYTTMEIQATPSNKHSTSSYSSRDWLQWLRGWPWAWKNNAVHGCAGGRGAHVCHLMLQFSSKTGRSWISNWEWGCHCLKWTCPPLPQHKWEDDPTPRWIYSQFHVVTVSSHVTNGHPLLWPPMP